MGLVTRGMGVSGGGAVCDYPAVSDVRDGIDFDSGLQIGVLKLPLPSVVLRGNDYGAYGTEFKGESVSGGGGGGGSIVVKAPPKPVVRIKSIQHKKTEGSVTVTNVEEY